jgi:hypothetical protein
MSLREEQIHGPRLSKDQAFVLHPINAVIVWALSYFWWQPLLGVPEEWRSSIAFISAALFFFPLFGYIESGYAGAQEWAGHYNGESYSSGIYCLTKPPFPILLFVLWLFLPKLYKKFFWTMGPVISVKDITLSVTAQFLSNEGTRKGVRMLAKSVLVFKMESVPHYLIQTTNDTDQTSLYEAVSSLYSASIKTSPLANYSAFEVFAGEHQHDQATLAAKITEQFGFIKNYGISLDASPIVEVSIEDKKIQSAFDQVAASSVLDESADKMADRVKAFMKKNPGMDEAVVWALLSGSSGGDAGPGINIFRMK